MRQQKIIIGIGGFLILAAIFALLIPSILRAIPSRYVALMPEPIQALGVREHVAALPTPQATADISGFLSVQPAAQATNFPALAPVLVTTEETTIEPTEQPAAATATASPAPSLTPIAVPPSARLKSVRHQFQSWNNCGPATLAMGLSFFEIYLLQSTTAAFLKPNPEDRNVSPYEMVDYIEQNTDLKAIERGNGNLDIIRRLLANNIPVIIETGIDPPGQYSWMEWYGHYYLIVAYSDQQERVWVYDSWLGSGINENSEPFVTPEGKSISYREMDRYWRDFNRSYVAIYRPEQEALLREIIGDQMNDGVMWQASLDRNLEEIRAETENAFLWFNLGTAYNGLGDFEKAATAFDRARELGLPWRMLWYQFGPYEAYLETGRFQDVIDLADATLYQRPYFEESFYYRGLAYQARGDPRRASQDFNRAADFNPRFSRAIEALASLGG